MIGTRKSTRDGKTIIRNALIVIVICAIGGYAGFQSKKIISGPQITIQSPSTTSADDSIVDVSGIVKNVSVVTLNDRLIPIDEAGQFKEKVLLYPGYNVIKLKVTDKFGACITKELQLVYTDKKDVGNDNDGDIDNDISMNDGKSDSESTSISTNASTTDSKTTSATSSADNNTHGSSTSSSSGKTI
jgi:hypothetical protein